MTIGIVILAHTHLYRTRQLARTLASRNVRVVVHVDANTDDRQFDWLRKGLARNTNVIFAPRIACDWGGFSLVRAGMDAAELLLKQWPGVSHVAQISGSCLPIRPIEDLTAFLDQNIGRDFVESFCATNGKWVAGGLSSERFTLYFPFSWRKQRWLFDKSVDLQRMFGVRRAIPEGLEPHVGSQWWCLSNVTLKSILNDPLRKTYDRFFKHSWIPDEGYIPTLVRRHSSDLVSASLTLSKFDEQGRPHVFYDDHVDLLEQSDLFFARKVWQGADGLYKRFLGIGKASEDRAIADDLGMNRIFEDARTRRCEGREGRLTVGRFPAAAYQRQPATCQNHTVLIGMGHVFEDLDGWLSARTNSVVHGRLYKSNSVNFADVPPHLLGAIPANPKVRDVNPEQFLCNLLWNGRGQHQAWMYELSDGPRMGFFAAHDKNSRIIRLKGSWLLELLARPKVDQRVLRNQARRLIAAEQKLDKELALAGRDDLVSITLAELVSTPERTIGKVLDQLSPADEQTTQIGVPAFRDLGGLRTLVEDLIASGIPQSAIGQLPDELPGETQGHNDAKFAAG